MDTIALSQLATSLAADSIRSTTEAGSGHPTSAMSSAHLVATLLDRHLRFDLDDPRNLANDRLVLSKGHAAPLVYSALVSLGVIGHDQLMELRTHPSPLQGHPIPGLPLIDVATGSLGQGLANGLGMALGLRRVGSPGRVFVILGDSEMSEGSVWEAMELAAHYRLSNLIAILDMNRLGQTGATRYGWDPEVYMRRATAFGWEAVDVDGHDPGAVGRVLDGAASADSPMLVVARTIKGFGVSFLADAEGRHGKPLPHDEAERALNELGNPPTEQARTSPPPNFHAPELVPGQPELPVYHEAVATRTAFGEALAAHAASNPRVLVLDGEVSNSTKTEAVEEDCPESFFQMYIAEQAMVGAAVGLQAVGFRPVVATFAAFLTRAHDFIRMGAISRADMLLSGSHAGVSIGEDGPSQMGLDDLAMMRATPGSTVLYPADGNSTVGVVGEALRQPGITYIRTTREDTPRLYGEGQDFPIGGSRVLRSSVGDAATIVGAGVTVFEALQAADQLGHDQISTRVIDAYSVQPIDAVTLRTALEDTGLIVVVEDHLRAGGLGDAVLDALEPRPSGKVIKLCVDEMPGSASPQQQRHLAGISADAIVAAVRKYSQPTT